MPLGSTFRLGGQTSFAVPDLAPDAPFWAIGDVHGQYDLLAPLLDRVMREGEPVVLLGDYINKGPDSAAVLRLVRQATATGQITALRGNHEQLLLQYLARPRVLTDSFFGLGGLATLHSFGIACTEPVLDLKQMSRLRNALRAGLGELEDWIGTLPYFVRSGNVVALHAGADPRSPIESQHPASFCWGHPRFATEERSDGDWIIHGHQPVVAVSMRQRRIAINTVDGKSGQLSAVRIASGGISTL